jgi:hypothetical protein
MKTKNLKCFFCAILAVASLTACAKIPQANTAPAVTVTEVSDVTQITQSPQTEKQSPPDEKEIDTKNNPPYIIGMPQHLIMRGKDNTVYCYDISTADIKLVAKKHFEAPFVLKFYDNSEKIVALTTTDVIIMDVELNVESDAKIKPGSMLSRFVYNPESKGYEYYCNPERFCFTDSARKHIVYTRNVEDGVYITDLDTQEEKRIPEKFEDMTFLYIGDMFGEYYDDVALVKAYIYNEMTAPKNWGENPVNYIGYVYVNSKGEIVKYEYDNR